MKKKVTAPRAEAEKKDREGATKSRVQLENVKF